MTQEKFFLMMFGGLFLTVLVFSVVAYFIVTRPNFKVHGAEEPAAGGEGGGNASGTEVSSPSTEAGKSETSIQAEQSGGTTGDASGAGGNGGD